MTSSHRWIKPNQTNQTSKVKVWVKSTGTKPRQNAYPWLFRWYGTLCNWMVMYCCFSFHLHSGGQFNKKICSYQYRISNYTYKALLIVYDYVCSTGLNATCANQYFLPKVSRKMVTNGSYVLHGFLVCHLWPTGDVPKEDRKRKWLSLTTFSSVYAD